MNLRQKKIVREGSEFLSKELVGSAFVPADPGSETGCTKYRRLQPVGKRLLRGEISVRDIQLTFR